MARALGTLTPREQEALTLLAQLVEAEIPG